MILRNNRIRRSVGARIRNATQSKSFFFTFLTTTPLIAAAGQPALPTSALNFADFVQPPSGGLIRSGPNLPYMNQPATSEYVELFRQLDSAQGDNAFYANSSYWPLTNAIDPAKRYSSETLDALKANFKGAKIPCPAYNCILFGPGLRIWIITADKEGNLVDFALILKKEDKLGKLPKARNQTSIISSTLDTTFNHGQGNNDFAKDGVFCTSFLHEDKENRRNSYSIQYMRRVLSNGKLEHKKIDHWEECLKPW